MPRKARNDRLDTRTARLKLKPKPEPYWFTLQEGRAIGYRRSAGGKSGTWIARHYSAEEGRKYASLASADDTLDADGATTLTFAQAQGRAAEWFREIERGAGRVVAPIKVREAMDAYLDDYRARGGKAEGDLKATIAAHILPELGDKQVATLTNAMLRGWHQRLAVAPARLRTAAKARKKNTRKAASAEETRARRSTLVCWTPNREPLGRRLRGFASPAGGCPAAQALAREERQGGALRAAAAQHFCRPRFGACCGR